MKYGSKFYLNEIENNDNVYEILSERFDNALSLLPEHSIIYGGAIRDSIAGKELKGDLDIAITAIDEPSLQYKLRTDPRWVIDENKYKLFTEYKKALPTLTHVSDISCFTNVSGKKVQIIVAKQTGKYWFDSVINLVRTVDIICCGVFMTYDGRIFEGVPGAYEHCKKGILVANPDAIIKYIENLSKRIHKLTSRGWENKIDIHQCTKIANKIKKKQQSRLYKENQFNKYEHSIKTIDFFGSSSNKIQPPLAKTSEQQSRHKSKLVRKMRSEFDLDKVLKFDETEIVVKIKDLTLIDEQSTMSPTIESIELEPPQESLSKSKSMSSYKAVRNAANYDITWKPDQ